MGSLLLAGGEPGHRYSLKHGSVMIHRELDTFLKSVLLPRLARWHSTKYERRVACPYTVTMIAIVTGTARG